MPIHQPVVRYRADGVPLVVVAGREYGTGSSRDSAARGNAGTGIRTVIAEGFERIHRANLADMGILPLEFTQGANRKTLELDGSERLDIMGIEAGLAPGMAAELRVHRQDGSMMNAPLRCRLDTAVEVEYYRHGGILPFVLRRMLDTA